MLHFDTNNPSNTDTNTSSKSLFAFKPRQVILAERNPRSKMTAFALKEENSSKITSLTPELKGIFHQSILHYLHRNGYSRTLKRFQSEAQIQSDIWKVSSLHLEDIFCKYNACNADSNLNTSKKPVLGNDEVIKKDNVCATDEETTSKKKKKGNIESDNGAIEDQSEVIDKKMVQSGKNCGQISDIIVHELETKPKKKKTKHDVDSSSQAQEAKSDLVKKPVDGTINGLRIDDSTKKTKDKKKKGTVESASCAIEDQSNVTNKKKVESGQNCVQISEDIIVNELETKPKKKKKTKHDSDSPGAAEVKSDVSKKPVDDTINGLEMEESTKKKKDKKKKGTVESDDGAFKDQSKVTDKKMVESGKNCGQILEDIIVNERETKPKKKKMKPDLDSAGQAEEAKTAVLKKPINDTINGLDIDDLTKKTKDKKKKSVQEDKAEPSTTNENEFITEVAQKERKNKKKSNTHSAVEDDQVNQVRIEAENETSQPDVSRKEKKSSKKRKRSLSDENDHLSTEMTISEESKRQKTETSKEQNKKDGSKVNEINAQETYNKQLDGQENGKLESGAQKSTRKQSNSSAETKTVNAFQRVKIDRVEFAHEKLQDNSYWAKDGAEIGYGAKAQEVLGQVRGRDFRHEKTKKKRGSYRGGLIDLQSHSVKFNYSDNDE